MSRGPDAPGPVRAVTDGTGTLKTTYQTDEFGVPTVTQGSSAQAFRFTGEQRDAETGLEYLRARYYLPRLGRFLGRDPLSGSVASPLTLNRYSYVENNPPNSVDPTGLADQGISKVNFDNYSLCGMFGGLFSGLWFCA